MEKKNYLSYYERQVSKFVSKKTSFCGPWRIHNNIFFLHSFKLVLSPEGIGIASKGVFTP